mmetsp:Transcript_9284/g.26062  ORF Transcript_9284/g.26062 Transcript_9284/m.26062 type:complete len:235 (+) Transcript_9284:275-979(+)
MQHKEARREAHFLPRDQRAAGALQVLRELEPAEAAPLVRHLHVAVHEDGAVTVLAYQDHCAHTVDRQRAKQEAPHLKDGGGQQRLPGPRGVTSIRHGEVQNPAVVASSALHELEAHQSIRTLRAGLHPRPMDPEELQLADVPSEDVLRRLGLQSLPHCLGGAGEPGMQPLHVALEAAPRVLCHQRRDLEGNHGRIQRRGGLAVVAVLLLHAALHALRELNSVPPLVGGSSHGSR